MVLAALFDVRVPERWAVAALFDVRAPVRVAIAAGFALAIALASIADPPRWIATTGPLGAFGFDKWIHFGSYAVLAAVVAYALLERTWRALAAVALATICFGLAVEGVQSTIPWRTRETADAVVNAVGTLVGLAWWQSVTAMASEPLGGAR